MIAPLSSQYRTRTQHPLAAYRVSVDGPGRLDTNDRLEWNRDPTGGRLVHTDWSRLPAVRFNLAERGDKVHDPRGRRPTSRLHVAFLYNRLLVLRHAVLRFVRGLGLIDAPEHKGRKRVHRSPAPRGRKLRVYGEESGLVLRDGKPRHQRDHQSNSNTVADPDCGA